MAAIPVIALTGYLGAGKTSLLNHVLRAPGARIGVVINDFGELNVDAALVTGQIDEPASITGGCICCLPDEGGLDDALERLTDPRLGLDAIIVEASGLADPVALARLIRFSGVERIRPGGVIDVIDAVTHFDTVDRDGTPPARYGAASLIVVNKLDQIPEASRDAAVERIEMRVRERNPDAHVVGAIGARIDPTLLYDVSDAGDGVGADVVPGTAHRCRFGPARPHSDDHDHVHAVSVTATSDGCIDPGVLIDLLEEPPAGVYRLKGTVAVRYRARVRTYTVNVVGSSLHIATAPRDAPANCLVAIGTRFDVDDVRARADAALRPHDGSVPTLGHPPPAAVPTAQHLEHFLRIGWEPWRGRDEWGSVRTSRRRRGAGAARGRVGGRHRRRSRPGDRQGRRRGHRRHRGDTAVRARNRRRARAADHQEDRDRLAAQQAVVHPARGAAAQSVRAVAADPDPDARRDLSLLRGRREGVGSDHRARQPMPHPPRPSARTPSAR